MNPDLQQPNTPPVPKQDLFMSPDLPPDVQQTKPKGKKKVFIILAVLGLLLVGATIFAVLTREPSSNAPAAETVVRQEVSDPEPTARLFMQYLASDNYLAAYAMLSPALQKKIDQKSFEDVFFKTVKANLKLSECQQYNEPETTYLNNQQVSKVKLSCPDTNGQSIRAVAFYLTTSDPVLIDAINFEEDIE